MLECKDKEMEGGSMLTLEFVRAFIGEKMFARGMQEYTEANVFNMEILSLIHISEPTRPY